MTFFKIKMFTSVFNRSKIKPQRKRERKMKKQENKLPRTVNQIGNDICLFRLVNPKQDGSKSHAIYSKAQKATTIKEAFEQGYRTIDIAYDSMSNGKFKKPNVLIARYLKKDHKELYLTFLKEFEGVKLSPQMEKNVKEFTALVNKL